MGKIEIKIANQSDAVAISLLGRVTFTETFGHLFHDKNDLQAYLLQTFSVDKIENSLNKAENAYWIAYSDRLRVGFAKLKLNAHSQFVMGKNICQLQKIYVLNDFHALKIGFKLQDVLLKKARELQATSIWLSVLDSNDKAISFYKKNYFRVIGQHDFQIGKEHFEFIVMAKTLKSAGDSN